MSEISEKIHRIKRSVTDLLDETDLAIESMGLFQASDDIEKVEHLLDPVQVTESQRGRFVIKGLEPFFDLIFWIHHSGRGGEWMMEDFCWKGQQFHLEPQQVRRLRDMVPDLSPLEVRSGPAATLLKAMRLDFIELPLDAKAFLFKPSPSDGFILITDTPNLWREDQIRHAQRLINDCYNF